MPPVPTWLARTWLIGGIVGAIAGLITAGFAWVVLGTAADASVRSLELASDVLDSVGGTVISVDAVLDDVSDGLRTTQQSMADASVTLTQLSALTSNLGDLVGEDIPASLESVRASLAPIQATAGLLDGTLTALSFVGVDYDPDVPLDEAIDDLDARLAEIPQRLRDQAPLIESAAESLSGFGGDTLTIAQDLSDLRTRLSEASFTVGSYRQTVTEADALLADVESAVGSRLTVLRVAIVVLGLGLATTQTVPIAFGWWLLAQNDSNTVGGDSKGE